MSIYDRRNKLLDYINNHQFATVKELSGIAFSSESSVRRDIRVLEQKGYVKSIYGGVVCAGYENSVVPVDLRDNSNNAIKNEIAKRAAEYVFDGATIIMDGSSTVRKIVKYIGDFNGLKIITNNGRLISEYNGKHELYCTGGRYLPKSNIFVGSAAESFVAGIHADILFLSSQAVSLSGEISDASEEETALRRIMLKRAKMKIFLCDSTKLGLERTFALCSKDDVDVILCDKKLPWE